MSDDLCNTTPTIRLERRRCIECGRYWAYETFHLEEPECPVCAGREIERLKAKVAKLDRVINALRGALNRRRKASKA
ncbi:MAG TPA: hypothetical protein VHM19_23030 [Polyangiales bacterium]|jgi:hypothetical protein|nr:hypothetical protein [Polyangiales bacterium]